MTILMYLARRVHKPRYQGIQRMQKLRTQLAILEDVVSKLEKNKDKYQKLVVDLSREAINKKADEMQAKMDKQLAGLKKEQEKQKLQAEAERLKKLAEEMEQARKAKEEEERKRKEAEDEARHMKEMEDAASKRKQLKRQNITFANKKQEAQRALQ